MAADKLPQIQERRREVARRYRERLSGWAARRGVKMPAELPDLETNDYLFALILPDARRREAFLAFLKTRGVMATFHSVPLHSSPFWQRYVGGSPSLPVTDRVAAALVRLPLHPRLTEEDLDRVVSAVEEAPV